ncbi:MAG: protein translocase subunit SecF [Dehalococcoidia bacterium]|nr:protein translocase subunit SecF [Dehalococcoidia bacterium]
MDFVRYRMWFLGFSLLVIVAGIVAMTIPPAFRVGIDFAGGSAVSVELAKPANQAELRQLFTDAGHNEAVIQKVGETGFLVRTNTLAETQKDDKGVIIKPSGRETIENALMQKYGSGLDAWTLTFAKPVDEAALKAELAAAGRADATVTKVSDLQVTIVTTPFKPAPPASAPAEMKPAEQAAAEAKPASETTQQAQPPSPPLGEREQLEKALSDKFGAIKSSTVQPDHPWKTLDISSVSPSVARETVRNAIIAVVVASFAILLFVWWAFRKVQASFAMGAAAVIALVHDVLVTLGLFSILGKFINVEVNAIFIGGMLTVVGYSVHDTIVVFDRIRENSIRFPSRSLATIINDSIAQTISRSLNTSLTTLIAIMALLLLGGPTIASFLLALMIGIVTGTYSSIFIAAQLLVVWRQREWLGPFSRRKAEVGAAPATR